ncbi:MAG: hypothetical protein P1Q69_17395, partial [Candidatus Thorarchaeota archaeon]|nr:hypothetical protein [Candidatus Thorarchaeota archaeon]
GFLLFSLLMIVFLRTVVFGWGLHNPFHVAYLLIGFSFFQVLIVSGLVTRNIKDPVDPEEHKRIRNSSILIGYVWSLLLYIGIMIWIVTIWQIQLGVDWPLSNYVPDAYMLLLIASIAFLHFPLTVSAFFWQWNGFRASDGDTQLVLDESTYRKRSGLVAVSMIILLVLFYCLEATIEGTLDVLSGISPTVLGVVILFVIVIFGALFWYEFRKGD